MRRTLKQRKKGFRKFGPTKEGGWKVQVVVACSWLDVLRGHDRYKDRGESKSRSQGIGTGSCFYTLYITHMYLRETKQKRVGGQVITHLQLAESTWNPDKKRSETKIIYNCGRIDEPEVAGCRKDRLIDQIIQLTLC